MYRRILFTIARKLAVLGKLIFEAYKEWVKDKGTNLATGLAFYQSLSIAPLVAFVYLLSLKTFGLQKTKEVILPLIADFFPPNFIEVIKFLLTREKGFPPTDKSTFAGVTIVTFILGTVNYFAQLKDSIELIWGDIRDRFGVIEAIKRNYDDVKTTVSSLFVVTIFVIINGILPHPYLGHSLVISLDHDFGIEILKVVIQIVFISVLYTFFFKSMPPHSVSIREALPAGILGGILQEIGREIMIVIVGKETDTSITASLLAFQLWFFYSNCVLMYSAEFSKVYVFYKRNTTLKNIKSFYPKNE
ncbi:MAG: YihY/virulence factor BrkB family protein [Sporocytophaga sp.]|uniref:YihY/virulence factor BrkB family protein n=1 Tax=Sporocytophaga sp. TaxID=2231183 RepID=UPI001B201ABD|nr:YihY/virulence factor BrkB family protein [Sporocytophaga sp.]MBO9700927.1 YihY/virulence factor BrkB family protein [Sporocytophaga sp.]